MLVPALGWGEAPTAKVIVEPMWPQKIKDLKLPGPDTTSITGGLSVVGTGTKVYLRASGTDPDGGAITGATWTLGAIPGGSTATLTAGPITNLYTLTTDKVGDYNLSLTVKDAQNETSAPVSQVITAAKGIADPQKDGKCLKCHLTAYGVDAALIVKGTTPEEKGFVAEEGVQCESCHGPGSLYKSRKTMKDKTAAVAAGLIIPDEKLCKTCHNPESPSYKEFNYAEAKKKIEHPNPNKGKPETE
ncbi:MAG: hypothetical protein EXS58_13495 [Candidatus Latescibacteria bacterium]|nr:hypothetical protein [Candidatus Latescibacterota bacterium]